MEWKRLTSMPKRKTIMTGAIGLLFVASLLGPSSGCDFPAIYNFGDSNSDTGSTSAAFGQLHSPFGETFFGRPSGRNSDGRLIIDFIAEEFNKQLKEKVSQLRTKLPDASLVYVDIYSAKYSLISNAKKYGFVGPFEYCCGDLSDYKVACGRTAVVNGSEIFGASCSDPSKYISWDGAHYTEAANQWIAKRILDGSLSDPPVPITGACH
ncbi:hypothetical protein SLEP1_g59067 [Rubroshorea leprosula]|uniref:GDSL esterase/lipase n=1 Tax=Rubroshorea leprosula TaxID=152421 RepID=A0AAV5MR96_9ROSI|nr:hypothetical protein SLEP1_g59067 [Rubroshorea leprosula]